MRGRRIAIVENNADTAEGLRRLFVLEGAEPVVCATISEAEALVASGPPPLWLVDILMPDGSGIDFLGRLKSEHPGVEAIVQTGFSDPDLHAAAYAAGACAVLVKPFDVAQVKRAIDVPPIAKALDIVSDSEALP